ncbi:SH3 domain-containing protein [Devosia sp.]|uniref:SH3 domain-containing protein n=1 Tax=Devosia sp. TaxID=1871048 RepID=UPI001AC493E1|nr:SH3 domain-containing protein [Devosia sp.]MBN9335233.1 SH3 domain-containing protein [Devosia sp.]
MHKIVALAALFSTATLLIGTSAAWAQPGVATSGVNVRSGPGTSFSKLGSLKTGELVDVQECQGSWCYVDRKSDKDGWVAANYLKPVAIQDDADDAKDIPFNFGVTVGANGPSISFGIGNQPAPPPPPPPQPQPNPAADKACFYAGIQFTGQSACVNIGASSTFLVPGWDNEIESFKIIGAGKVEICRDPNFGGGCAVYVSSQSSLPPSYANNVSSYQTYY